LLSLQNDYFIILWLDQENSSNRLDFRQYNYHYEEGVSLNIISHPIEIDKDSIDSRYRFVIAVAQRAKQLNDGAIQTKRTKAKKTITIALEELIGGSVYVLSGKAAVEAQKEAMKLPYQGLIDESKKKRVIPNGMTELEKELKVFLEEKTGQKIFKDEEV
jgi:DNA-directed RNA polymerase omega subunit